MHFWIGGVSFGRGRLRPRLLFFGHDSGGVHASNRRKIRMDTAFTFSATLKLVFRQEKPIPRTLDRFGLPEGARYVRTGDISIPLRMSSDLIRHHLKCGNFPEPKKRDGKGRLFTRTEVGQIRRIRSVQQG